ncbi:Uncharacterized protein dnm_084280 [Desulfonema magnum]|uniref:Uncharacterized protein n=1 Tax=Desulfonema magnum TaxID=45655 RepID=A0A975BW73_9BACT|nr:Uncharacterized protein dnm_084280 [Desulfonema magnum]
MIFSNVGSGAIFFNRKDNATKTRRHKETQRAFALSRHRRPHIAPVFPGMTFGEDGVL